MRLLRRYRWMSAPEVYKLEATASETNESGYSHARSAMSKTLWLRLWSEAERKGVCDVERAQTTRLPLALALACSVWPVCLHKVYSCKLQLVPRKS